MDNFPVCTHCGFTFGEYRARGLLGCPHCYTGFGEALQADIAWLHQALAFTNEAGNETAQDAVARAASESVPATAPAADSLARWREQIAEAVRAENYEEAARLKRLLRELGSAGSGPGLGLA